MEYNIFDICEEILDYFDHPKWIGKSDIDDYLDIFYNDMDKDDRWFICDRMEKFVNYVDQYNSINDICTSEDLERFHV